jgi:hypothetical protein
VFLTDSRINIRAMLTMNQIDSRRWKARSKAANAEIPAEKMVAYHCGLFGHPPLTGGGSTINHRNSA